MTSFFSRGRTRSETDAHASDRSKAKHLTYNGKVIHSKLSRIITFKCRCCGTVLHCDDNALTLKCTVCSVQARKAGSGLPENTSTSEADPLSLHGLEDIVNACFSRVNKLSDRNVEIYREVFDPVSTYLSSGFHSATVLQKSFISRKKHELVDYEQLSRFYQITLRLPTRKPLYRMLRSCNELLKEAGSGSDEFKWIFIIWSNPVVRQSLIHEESSGDRTSQIKSIAYEVAKRCVGYLSNLPVGPAKSKLLHYLKYMPDRIFQNQVETVNLFITFQMARLLRKAFAPGTLEAKKRKNQLEAGSDKGDLDDNNLHTVLGACRFKIEDYANNWRLRSAVRLMEMLFIANNRRRNYDRSTELSPSEFYNVMFDFIDYRKDFLSWRRQGKYAMSTLENTVSVYSVEPGFSLCAYPFSMSIGIKKMVMDLETKRIMTTEAEQAFLNSLDTYNELQVTLKIRVRRSNIVEDSLKCIKDHEGDLRKPLKVQFVNEQGVDGGGLRKEWFLLLTRALVRPERGLFSVTEESGFTWLSPCLTPDSQSVESDELYYLFGILIGLAVFNGIILDLRFPGCLYRKLCSEPLTFGDFAEIYPETATNIKKMLAYEQPDFADTIGLSFETTIDTPKSGTGDKTDVELCPKGRHRRVTLRNKQEFVHLWTDFYLRKSVDRAFARFSLGFRQVFSECESIRLFSPSELEKLISGSIEDNCYDFRTLRSVTKYSGGFTDKSQTVVWFWDILQDWDIKLQRKLLSFATGSDRVPPTGICTLSFKISRIGPHDSEKLPVAHTCFNELCMWDYSSKVKLRDKLWWAVTQSEGFDLK